MPVCYPSRYVSGTEDGKGRISKPQAWSLSGKTRYTPQSVVRPLQRARECTALSLGDKPSPGTSMKTGSLALSCSQGPWFQIHKSTSLPGASYASGERHMHWLQSQGGSRRTPLAQAQLAGMVSQNKRVRRVQRNSQQDGAELVLWVQWHPWSLM